LLTHGERICLDTRRHSVVLVPPFVRAFVLAAAGGFLATRPFPLPFIGALLVIVAALLALRAVWRWERTRVLVTTEKLVVVHGTLRRRTTAIRLERIGPIEVEQGVLARIFGYGTLIAGPLRLSHVPQPKQVYAVVERLDARGAGVR
jgi:uncharacterized membrane protein YdbT with pleckstrin-like domain